MVAVPNTYDDERLKEVEKILREIGLGKVV